MTELPKYFFRIRENGAAVFRVNPQGLSGRLELTEIAVVNARNGNIKPQGDTALSPADTAAIGHWLSERQASLAAEEAAEPARCIAALNRTAHWAQSKADPAELAAVTEDLLLAMHDLRAVLVRKKAANLDG